MSVKGILSMKTKAGTISGLYSTYKKEDIGEEIKGTIKLKVNITWNGK